jgi:hypothetical protein
MLNTYVNHGHAMNNIIGHLRDGKIIEAIKSHRVLYGIGLKESKDAVEAIRDALGIQRPAYAVQPAQFVVFSRFHESDYDYSRYNADDRADADTFAARTCDSRDEVIIAQVVARSVTTRSMKNV